LAWDERGSFDQPVSQSYIEGAPDGVDNSSACFGLVARSILLLIMPSMKKIDLSTAPPYSEPNTPLPSTSAAGSESACA